MKFRDVRELSLRPRDIEGLVAVEGSKSDLLGSRDQRKPMKEAFLKALR